MAEEEEGRGGEGGAEISVFQCAFLDDFRSVSVFIEYTCAHFFYRRVCDTSALDATSG